MPVAIPNGTKHPCPCNPRAPTSIILPTWLWTWPWTFLSSPLSRTNSPFEFAGLSPRQEIGKRPASLLTEARTTILRSACGYYHQLGENNYLYSILFSCTLSSSAFPSSENDYYENDSRRSESWPTFSSPFAAPTRLVDISSYCLRIKFVWATSGVNHHHHQFLIFGLQDRKGTMRLWLQLLLVALCVLGSPAADGGSEVGF